ncbi:hypothetical protein SIO53_000935 [Enterobacter roggenkampii]|uniref:hypothetical protein n=1 Tax=Enterobacter roggenkampii TaxID=1812935 RepID=UPI0018671BD4|nr:hypothetical protein [Enterobacter roggenkampii]EKM4697912.1 hypothetical protein [Enterobacter roggenkampii]ELW9293568.1 hypothetical protein [Enterobacter roggenkampii]
MSVKLQFLKKLQARQPAPVPAISKSQADIAEFRQRMAQLQDEMDAWLTDTGLNVEPLTVSVPDLLVEGGAFEISGIVLRYDSRAVNFMPIFLYGQGVAGCVEVTFCSGENVISQGRLFMRVGNANGWIFTPPDTSSRSGQLFDEGVFFGLILALLP